MSRPLMSFLITTNKNKGYVVLSMTLKKKSILTFSILTCNTKDTKQRQRFNERNINHLPKIFSVAILTFW